MEAICGACGQEFSLEPGEVHTIEVKKEDVGTGRARIKCPCGGYVEVYLPKKVVFH